MMEFNYKAFIDEIIRLIKVADDFSSSDKKHDSNAFKAWRHAVLDFIYQIERQKYSINCSLSTRLFHICGYGTYSQSSQQNKFDRDLSDTLNELKLLVTNFEKYGDPKEHDATKLTEIKEQYWPDKVTLHWLFKHMPARLWLALISALVSAVFVGYQLASFLQSHQVNPINKIEAPSKK